MEDSNHAIVFFVFLTRRSTGNGKLIELARDMREANTRGERLGLSDGELAFYDALETNDSAVQVLGDENPPCDCSGVSPNRPK